MYGPHTEEKAARITAAQVAVDRARKALTQVEAVVKSRDVRFTHVVQDLPIEQDHIGRNTLRQDRGGRPIVITTEAEERNDWWWEWTSLFDREEQLCTPPEQIRLSKFAMVHSRVWESSRQVAEKWVGLQWRWKEALEMLEDELLLATGDDNHVAVSVTQEGDGHNWHWYLAEHGADNERPSALIPKEEFEAEDCQYAVRTRLRSIRDGREG